MNGNNKAVAVLLLLLCGMAMSLCFGVLCLMLCAVGGGIGAVLIPLVIYAGVRFAEKQRERFREVYNLNSAAFICIAELPSVIVSGVLYLLLLCSAEGGDLSEIADEMIGAALAVFSGSAALLIMIGTVICSIVTSRTRKKLSSQPDMAEENTEV